MGKVQGRVIPFSRLSTAVSSDAMGEIVILLSVNVLRGYASQTAIEREKDAPLNRSERIAHPEPKESSTERGTARTHFTIPQ